MFLPIYLLSPSYVFPLSARRHNAQNVQALQPVSLHPDPVPNVLPEILLLVGDPDGNAPSTLAYSLWIKYRMSVDWAWKVWDNTVASLRQIPDMTPDVEGRTACALRYGLFLYHVDHHLPTGLDDQVLRWFLGPGKNEVAALSADAWNVLTIVLLYLAVHGALKTTVILQGLVYPAWQLGASASTAQHRQSLDAFLRAANKLCRDLLLREDGSGDTTPPIDIFDVQRIRTRRKDVYREPHFPLLVASIPHIVSLENNEHVAEDVRSEAASLRHALSEDQDFRRAAFRNLDVIRESFEHSLRSMEDSGENLDKRIVAALKTLLSHHTSEGTLRSIQSSIY